MNKFCLSLAVFFSFIGAHNLGAMNNTDHLLPTIEAEEDSKPFDLSDSDLKKKAEPAVNALSSNNETASIERSIMLGDFYAKYIAQPNFSYQAHATSKIRFKNEEQAKVYYDMLDAFIQRLYFLQRKNDTIFLNATTLETFICEQVLKDSIVIDKNLFDFTYSNGATVAYAQATCMLDVLQKVSKEAVSLRNKLESEMNGKDDNEKAQIVHKMREAFKPLEDHIIAQYQMQNPPAVAPKHWTAGWKGHLLTATLASAVTLGAAYGALKIAHLKLTPAAA